MYVDEIRKEGRKGGSKEGQVLFFSVNVARVFAAV